MYFVALFTILGLASASHSSSMASGCLKVDALDLSLHDVYCQQPSFLTIATNTEENRLLDNVCNTLFPLPDDPDTFMVYTSRVYCDGSNEIISSIATQISTGVYRRSTPFSTVTQHIFGYAGCDSYLLYTCLEFGELFQPFILASSFSCRPVGLSCLRKIEEMIRDQGIPEVDLYVLPMKLPNRCVTQQLCLQPPNPFYNKLPGHASVVHV